ncbi:uncharacterized protein LOC132952433 [Metopolophium dirhodum]|uniref:uncharacterized protein LOC132952433 n=1 Tax=Metopolophium dirhodum TaxID=44670 RepID=UPI00298F9A27|nr:uncharacterized protein LOC132952433 [Metopolophium dirhodum]
MNQKSGNRHTVYPVRRSSIAHFPEQCADVRLAFRTFEFVYSNIPIMMAAVETVDLKVRVQRGNNVSALIKMFESNRDDLAPKRRQNTVIVSDGGRYAPRSDVTGTWRPIQTCGHGSVVGGKKNVGSPRKKIKPCAGFVKMMITKFGGLNAA